MTSNNNNKPQLPFGLGLSPVCPPSSCLHPHLPLPAPGTPLHDQVALSLSALFSTFYSTSLRYLGVSEILDWIEANGTIDAWILTGLEQGRTVDDVGNRKNLNVGKGAIRGVIRNALELDDGAWSISLREVAFSSSMSMSYEGVISQLKYNKSSPHPCLHTLISPSGLAMLKSAPLKHAFPICPPRTPPSPTGLLNSIRSLIQDKILTGPQWKSSAVWKSQVKKVFLAYHTMVKEVAESIICEPKFSSEYTIFLDTISQPIQLLLLIRSDFEEEFGENVHKGLLQVGDVGGNNLASIMKFCNSGRPTELLGRVQQRVEEKREKEKILADMKGRKEKMEGLRDEEKVLLDYLLKYKTNFELRFEEENVMDPNYEQEMETIRSNVELIQRNRDRLNAEISVDQARLAELSNVGKKSTSATTSETNETTTNGNGEVKQGSSKDLHFVDEKENKPIDPFSSNAPRAVPSTTSSKGKGKAINNDRSSVSRYSRAPNSIAPPLPMTSSNSPNSAPPNYTPPRTPPTSRSTTSKLLSNLLLNEALAADGKALVAEGSDDDDDYLEDLLENDGEVDENDGNCCESCAAALAHKQQLQSKSNGTTNQHPRISAPPTTSIPPLPTLNSENQIGEQPTSATKKKSKKKKKKKKKAKKLDSDEEGSSDCGDGDYIIEHWLPTYYNPPARCCPPDICTGDTPNYDNWSQLDILLFSSFWSAFKYELIDSLREPLEIIRDDMAKQFLKTGGGENRLKVSQENPDYIDLYLKTYEPILFDTNMNPNVRACIQKSLAISFQKLVDVFREDLNGVCICRLTNNLETVDAAMLRLHQCELEDREIPIYLPLIDTDDFYDWYNSDSGLDAILENRLTPADIDDLNHYLLSFADSFDTAIDRMIETDPYILANDFISLLKYQGGIRTFDAAVRIGRDPIGLREPVIGIGSGKDPLGHWSRILDVLTWKLKGTGETPLFDQIAQSEKQRGNALFASGEYLRSIEAFASASLIDPEEPSYWTNAAAARIKLATTSSYSEAVSDCTFALYYDPGNHKALYRRGTALASLGRWKDSIVDLAELVRISPENIPAKETLAWVQSRQSEAVIKGKGKRVKR